MGRIKTTMVKKTALQLINSLNSFTENFDIDKKILKDTMPSKSIRNKVAGYISRLIRQKNQQ